MKNMGSTISNKNNWIENRIKFILLIFLITMLSLLIVSFVSFGTLFELLSNSVLGLFGMRIGLTPSILGVGTLWGIASGGIAFIIAEIFRDLLSISYDNIPTQFTENALFQQWGIIENILIALIVVPLTILILTAAAAAQLDTVEKLWEILMVGYSGAIIGAYSEIISNLVPKSKE